MQTEVPALPVVCSDECKQLTRKIGDEPSITAASIKSQSACKSAAILLAKRKQLHPLLGGPYYKNSARVFTLTEPTKSLARNPVGQRVLSAKMLRVKQLQNQLTDAHYHLNELANENRLLKALQKRQDSALRRYEGTNAELPRIINSHHEELRVLQTKYKKLKAQHKDTCDLLKEKENELHNLQAQNKHLLQLSKDRSLGEREKLQGQVSDLNHRIKRQNETIQMLHRKLALESKSLKHQLNAEIAKNKIAQRHLNKTMEKLKCLEDLLDNREKKLYYSGQLPVFNKRKNMTSQSLTNLAGDGSNATELRKTVIRNRNIQDHEMTDKTLSTLEECETDVNAKISETVTNLTVDASSVAPKTETMASLDQVRKFRLQRSPLTQKLSARDKLRERLNETEFEESEHTENSLDPERFQNLYASSNQQDVSGYGSELLNLEQDLAKRNKGGAYKLPRELRKEFGYSTNESETEDETIHHTEQNQQNEVDPTIASKELHARLVKKISTNIDGKTLSQEKESRKAFTEEELERFVNEKLKFKRESIMQELSKKSFSKAECKAEMRQLRAAAGISESDSETDSGSESNKEQDKYGFVLKNAPEDSESENLHHLNEEFFKFDVNNQSDSGSEAEKQAKQTKSKVPKSLDVKRRISRSPILSTNTNEGVHSKSPDNTYEGGKQHLMDITKSWSELQEKIMRERETSEKQILALESELEDGVILEQKVVQRVDDDEVKKLLNNKKLSLPLSSRDNLKENIEQKLHEIDNKEGKKFTQPRRNSISLGSMNLGIEALGTAANKDRRSSSRLETEESQASECKLDEKTLEKNKTLMEKDLLASYPGVGSKFTSSIENDLGDIDATQAALQSMVLETKKQINESLKLKSKPNGIMKMDNLKKMSNHTEQEIDLAKKSKTLDKTVQKKTPAYKEEMSAEAKMISYNKEKLLAAMKAIDNNENVEFLDLQKSQRGNGSSRSQITENLYRGVPTHTKKKDDLIKELFGDGKGDTKSRNGCTKMH
ncbi:lebercilin-like isoform X1 [Neodiprion virginianus]|uniref:lebercilin-like isoform X1 n=1 Tax=Neodiprion virginianus TaxID=2961670 RepID=UPI001EE70A4C|nr:lebercilin-like isoform X1 [Neodiprion virginianus]